MRMAVFCLHYFCIVQHFPNLKWKFIKSKLPKKSIQLLLTKHSLIWKRILCGSFFGFWSAERVGELGESGGVGRDGTESMFVKLCNQFRLVRSVSGSEFTGAGSMEIDLLISNMFYCKQKTNIVCIFFYSHLFLDLYRRFKKSLTAPQGCAFV